MTTIEGAEPTTRLERMLVKASLPQTDESTIGLVSEAIRCGVAWGAEHGGLAEGGGNGLPKELQALAEAITRRLGDCKPDPMMETVSYHEDDWDDDEDDWDDDDEDDKRGIIIDGRTDARSRLGCVVAWERDVDCLTVRDPRDVSEARFETVAAFPTYEMAMMFTRLIESEFGGYDGWVSQSRNWTSFGRKASPTG